MMGIDMPKCITCILVFKNVPGVTPSIGPPIRFDTEWQGEGRVIYAKRGKVCFLAVGGWTQMSRQQ